MKTRTLSLFLLLSLGLGAGLGYIIYESINTPQIENNCCPTGTKRKEQGDRLRAIVSNAENTILIVKYEKESYYCTMPPCGKDCYALDKTKKIEKLYLANEDIFLQKKKEIGNRLCIPLNADGDPDIPGEFLLSDDYTQSSYDPFDNQLIREWQINISSEKAIKLFGLPPDSPDIKAHAIEMSDAGRYILLFANVIPELNSIEVSYENGEKTFPVVDGVNEFVVPGRVKYIIGVKEKDVNRQEPRETWPSERPNPVLNTHPRVIAIHKIKLKGRDIEVLEMKAF